MIEEAFSMNRVGRREIHIITSEIALLSLVRNEYDARDRGAGAAEGL